MWSSEQNRTILLSLKTFSIAETFKFRYYIWVVFPTFPWNFCCWNSTTLNELRRIKKLIGSCLHIFSSIFFDCLLQALTKKYNALFILTSPQSEKDNNNTKHSFSDNFEVYKNVTFRELSDKNNTNDVIKYSL